jgi:hypothetical protein
VLVVRGQSPRGGFQPDVHVESAAVQTAIRVVPALGLRLHREVDRRLGVRGIHAVQLAESLRVLFTDFLDLAGLQTLEYGAG